VKVLMTTDPIGGVWTYTLHLVRALRRYGVQTALASMGARLTGEQRREARAAGAIALFATDLALEWMRDRGSEVDAAGEWLLEVRDSVEPDLVHLNGFVHASLPWAAPVIVVAHSCVYSWFAAVRGQAPGREWQRYHDEVEQGLRAAEVVVAPTAAMMASLERHYVLGGERLVIHNGSGVVRVLEKQRYVLAAGRAWDEAKNVAAVERVAPRLPWPTRIVGAGTSDGVLPRSTLDELLGRASIYVAPARYEPFGLGALEAATAECALVLGDIDSLREVWGDAAAYVDPEDDRALERTLRRLIDNPGERRALAGRAVARSRAYTPERMAERYAAVYARAATTHALEKVA
jgi:glycogen(starch) synthase